MIVIFALAITISYTWFFVSLYRYLAWAVDRFYTQLWSLHFALFLILYIVGLVTFLGSINELAIMVINHA